MHSVEIYEFEFDEKTSNLLRKLSEESDLTVHDSLNESSVCFEEIEFFEENTSSRKEVSYKDTCSKDDDYDSLDESLDDLEDELAKLCSLESPWNKYARRELIGNLFFCIIAYFIIY